MSCETLGDVFKAHAGKVCDKWSSYIAEYERLFAPFRERPVRILEIGVRNGGSLEIWLKYFSNALAIIGCDIDPLCERLAYEDSRVCVIVGDVNEQQTYERIVDRSMAFDIIIDDGSHLSGDVIRTFVRYAPHLVDGGIYVLEDSHTSYWEQFGGGLYDPYSSLAFFKRLTDIVNHEHWGVARSRSEVLDGILAKYPCTVSPDAIARVHAVEFLNSMCIVRMAPVAANGLGQRFVAGEVEDVAQGHHVLRGVPYQFNSYYDQTSNPWSARATPPDEAIEQAERSLAECVRKRSQTGRRLVRLRNRERGLRMKVAIAKAGRQADVVPEAKTDYERYRYLQLMRRRLAGGVDQIPGLLSFMTPAWNIPVQFLDALADSVFRQDGGTYFEWVVLDNGTTDEASLRSLAAIGRHCCVRLFRVESNLGIVGGERYCLEHATGRYVLPLDADDLIEPDCVAVLTRFIVEHHYPALLYTDEDKLGSGEFKSAYFKPDWDPVLFLHSCYIAHLGAMDRRLALRLGVYTDKTAEGCPDWDAFIRFMNAGHVPQHIPEVLYAWRIHAGSTALDVAVKPYVPASQRATLQRALDFRQVPALELVNSPFFRGNVDWWYRHKRGAPLSLQSVVVLSDRAPAHRGLYRGLDGYPASEREVRCDDGVEALLRTLSTIDADLVHIRWDGVTPDIDEWPWDAAAMIALFPDAVMVGGALHDGSAVVDGPKVLGFGRGCDCPDRGRSLRDPGYFAHMWKPRSVSAVSSGHCVVKREFLLRVLPQLAADGVDLGLLGPWMGVHAAKQGKRIVFSPFMRARATLVPEDDASAAQWAAFLSAAWPLIPDYRFRSLRFGLDLQTANSVVSEATHDSHVAALQAQLLPYRA